MDVEEFFPFPWMWPPRIQLQWNLSTICMLSEQEKTQIYFNRDFFPAVAVVVAKAPCFLKTIAG